MDVLILISPSAALTSIFAPYSLIIIIFCADFSLFLSFVYKRLLYCEVITFWKCVITQ
jgi:hypothetical protein